jgi:hypothetical protein
MHKAFLARIVEEGPIPAIHGVVRWRACDLTMRLHEEFGLSVSDDTIYRALKKLGFSHMSAWPKAYKQNAEAMEAFKKTSPIAGPGTVHAPVLPMIKRTQSTYLFGAVCPERGAGAAPSCCRPATAKHAAPSRRDRNQSRPRSTPFLDQAGWHGAKALVVPSNISLVPLPPRAPELNGQENIWQTVCSFLDGDRGGSSTLRDERGLRRVGRRRASLTGDNPCRKPAESLSVLIRPS